MMFGFLGEAIALRIFGEMAANPFMLAHIPLTSVGCWVADHRKRSSSEAGLMVQPGQNCYVAREGGTCHGWWSGEGLKGCRRHEVGRLGKSQHYLTWSYITRSLFRLLYYFLGRGTPNLQSGKIP